MVGLVGLATRAISGPYPAIIMGPGNRFFMGPYGFYGHAGVGPYNFLGPLSGEWGPLQFSRAIVGESQPTLLNACRGPAC